LAKNGDGYRLSTYMYKERDSDGGKIKMGPLWDFNLSFGNIDYCTGGSPQGLVITDFNTVCGNDGWIVHFWWEKFLKDKAFYDKLKQRYTSHRDNQLSDKIVFGTIDSLTQLITPATGRNFEKWPILRRN
jgi:CotH kinase protein